MASIQRKLIGAIQCIPMRLEVSLQAIFTPVQDGSPMASGSAWERECQIDGRHHVVYNRLNR